jgi:hypothetical protein
VEYTLRTPKNNKSAALIKKLIVGHNEINEIALTREDCKRFLQNPVLEQTVRTLNDPVRTIGS